ncbi:hypothetical protein FRC09_011365, partial [Ceratobasidium sp. 395]
MSNHQPHCGACVKSGRESRCIYEAIRNKNLADQLEDRVNQLERMVERMEREGFSTTPSSATNSMASGVTQPSNEGWSKLPAESHDFMVDTFMTYLPKSYLQVQHDRFLQSLTLPENDPRSIHPAMISAVYLLACYHWSDSLSQYEEQFLTQAR